MPFNLKNVEAMYEKLINRILQGQIGRTVEVYIDHMLVKSQKIFSNLKDLEDIFNVGGHQYETQSGKKCVFRVKEGKFMGVLNN